ncbi:MAG: hypothetical protein QMD50_03155 [Patescibacteria group bacterium]|nr:hypothetical protein [Patescibacteria group bacterium]
MIGNVYKVSGVFGGLKRGFILELCATKVAEEKIKDHFDFETYLNEVEDEGIEYFEIYSDDIAGMDSEHAIMGYFLPCENDDLEKEKKMLKSIKKIIGPDSEIDKIGTAGIV